MTFIIIVWLKRGKQAKYNLKWIYKDDIHLKRLYLCLRQLLEWWWVGGGIFHVLPQML